jgi:hypothetical protein
MPPKRNLEPNYKTDLGKLLSKLFNEHPIVLEKFKKSKGEYYRTPSDITVCRDLINNFENAQKVGRMLPYSVMAHIKLKNILQHNKIWD